MNIGNTPQQKLAVIRHVHKRANIIGLVVGILISLAFFSTAMRVKSSEMALYALVVLVSFFCATRAFIWAYYWLASKLGVNTLAILAVRLNPVYETKHSMYSFENSIEGNTITEQGTRTETHFSMSAFIILALGLSICIWIGAFLAIKYIVLEIKLKKQLKAAQK